MRGKGGDEEIRFSYNIVLFSFQRDGLFSGLCGGALYACARADGEFKPGV